jgi:hypothetical protein
MCGHCRVIPPTGHGTGKAGTSGEASTLVGHVPLDLRQPLTGSTGDGQLTAAAVLLAWRNEVGRPERELDLSNPLHEFAAELRMARAQAGSPSYLVMARRSGGVSRTALSEAAGGDHLPKWLTVEGFYRACKLPIPPGLLERWERLNEQLKSANGAPNQTIARTDSFDKPEVADSARLPHRVRWRWPAIAVLLLVVTGATVHIADVLMLPVRASAPPKSTKLAVIVVQNKVAMGRSDLIEDSTPAYLSSRPVPSCSRNGCVMPGTLMSSDVALVADCYVPAAMMWNYNLDSSEVQTNPNRAGSKLWYHVVLPNGAGGYISEVYIAPAYRGGLGLPKCTVVISSPLPTAGTS